MHDGDDHEHFDFSDASDVEDIEGIETHGWCADGAHAPRKCRACHGLKWAWWLCAGEG